MSDWSWLKASLPSSRGDLNLRSAVLHAPAPFLASWSQSLQLMESILGQPLGPFSHTSSTLASLAVATDRPKWSSLDVIDVPLHQRPLSHAIDEASHHHLLSTAPDTRSRAVALSSSLHHAGDWLNVVPSAPLGLHLHDREFRCCLRYWLGVPLHSSAYSGSECHGMADRLGTTRLAVVAMETALHDTMQFAMCSSVLPNMPPWLPRRRLPVWCPVPFFVLLISCSHTGAMVALLP